MCTRPGLSDDGASVHLRGERPPLSAPWRAASRCAMRTAHCSMSEKGDDGDALSGGDQRRKPGTCGPHASESLTAECHRSRLNAASSAELSSAHRVLAFARTSRGSMPAKRCTAASGRKSSRRPEANEPEMEGRQRQRSPQRRIDSKCASVPSLQLRAAPSAGVGLKNPSTAWRSRSGTSDARLLEGSGGPRPIPSGCASRPPSSRGRAVQGTAAGTV